jgi:hypothetical protein
MSCLRRSAERDEGWDHPARQTPLCCRQCRRRFTRRSSSAFSGSAFADDIIVLAVLRYVRYRLSDLEVSEWLAERGILVDQSTIDRWGCNASCRSSRTRLANILIRLVPTGVRTRPTTPVRAARLLLARHLRGRHPPVPIAAERNDPEERSLRLSGWLVRCFVSGRAPVAACSSARRRRCATA